MDLSVIIPACGVQRQIAACLRSVTRCSRENIDMECIVVSDGSAGETDAVVGRYMERDNRIRLVILEEGETSDARNIGIEKASGKYILFLNTTDRLCEDAWEQIEAAVGEEYADFVAFSHIALRENGKFKAQMLPIPDVISTDEKEARRLMYADSVLNTCDGKLFKNRIIRDNNIFFLDVPAGTDFFFVTEYFEHCEGCLMTKAMILYCPQKNGTAVKDCSLEVRLDQAGNLYDYSVKAVKRYNDKELLCCVKEHFFRILMRILCAYARDCSYRNQALESIYESAVRNRFLTELLNEIDVGELRSRVIRYEYHLLKKGNAAQIRRYLYIKAKLQPSQAAGVL